jgi:hypothetical protein
MITTRELQKRLAWVRFIPEAVNVVNRAFEEDWVVK